VPVVPDVVEELLFEMLFELLSVVVDEVAPEPPAASLGGALTTTAMVALELENWRNEAVSVTVALPAPTPYICTAPPA
jgi:hypothetical protein